MTISEIRQIIRAEVESLLAEQSADQVVTRDVKTKSGKTVTARAVAPVAKSYVKDDKFNLGKCIEDLKGKEGIENPAAVCRDAEGAETGEYQSTRGTTGTSGTKSTR